MEKAKVYFTDMRAYPGKENLLQKLERLMVKAGIDNCRKAVYGYDQRAEVFGTKGAIAISNDSNSNAVFSGEEGVVAEKPMYFFLERYMMAYAHEVKSFVDAIENDTETEVNANDGLQPVLIGLAAKKSVQEGRPVTIKEIADEYNL